jgi:hypothetical protein
MHGDDEEVPAVSPEVVFGDAARRLSDLRNGPYSGAATAEAAALLSEAVRYLNYAGMHGGVTEPAEVAAVLAHLCTALYRIPQLLGLLGDWPFCSWSRSAPARKSPANTTTP